MCFYYASIRSLSHGGPFRYVFWYQWHYLLVWCMRNIIPGGKWREGSRNRHKAETNWVHIWDDKKYIKIHILLAVLSHLRNLYQLKYLNKKILKTTLLRTSTSVRGAKRIWIRNKNLQTEITVSLCVLYWISYTKVSGRTCLPPSGVKLGAPKIDMFNTLHCTEMEK